MKMSILVIDDDSDINELFYENLKSEQNFYLFSKELIQFRKAHNAFKPAFFWRGDDGNQNGLPQVKWLAANGTPFSSQEINNPNAHFLAYMLDGQELGDTQKLFVVAYNGSDQPVNFSLPKEAQGAHRVLDTVAWMEGQHNFDSKRTKIASEYVLKPRSLVVFEM